MLPFKKLWSAVMLASSFIAPSSYAADEASSVSTQIDRERIEFVLNLYLKSARLGQGQLMQVAFHPWATIHGDIEGQTVERSLTEISAFVDESGPASTLSARIVAIDIAGAVATARLQTDHWHGVSYIDLFTLLKRGGKWRIASNVFTGRGMTTKTEAAHADAAKAVYYVIYQNVKDEGRFQAYVDAVTPAITALGGVLVAAGPPDDTEGTAAYGRLVIFRYPSREVLESFLRSSDYAAIRLLREGATDWLSAIVPVHPEGQQ